MFFSSKSAKEKDVRRQSNERIAAVFVDATDLFDALKYICGYNIWCHALKLCDGFRIMDTTDLCDGLET